MTTDLDAAAEWLVSQGYPFDFATKDAPPSEFREAIVRAAFKDPTGIIHDNSLSLDEVREFVADEAGWEPKP